jgi:hypothetical protein
MQPTRELYKLVTLIFIVCCGLLVFFRIRAITWTGRPIYVFSQSDLNEELRTDFEEFDRIWRRVYSEIGDASDFLVFYIESAKSTNQVDRNKIIDFIKSEFDTRKK